MKLNNYYTFLMETGNVSENIVITYCPVLINLTNLCILKFQEGLRNY